MNRRTSLHITQTCVIILSSFVILSIMYNIQTTNGHIINYMLLLLITIAISALTLYNIELERRDLEKEIDDEIKRIGLSEKKTFLVEPLDESESMKELKENVTFVAMLKGREVKISIVRKKPENKYREPYEYETIHAEDFLKKYKIL